MRRNHLFMGKFLFSTVLLLVAVTDSYAGRIIKIDKNLTVTPLGLFMDYLEDRQGRLTIQDVSSNKYNELWKEPDVEKPSFGYSSSGYWVRLTFENVTSDNIEFYLEHEFTPMYYVKLYIPNRDSFRLIETGYQMPFEQRPIIARTYVFPIKIKAGSAMTCYLWNCNEGSMSIFMNVWSPKSFWEAENVNNRILFIIYSILLVMALYNIIMFLFVRRIAYLYYVFLIFSVILTFMSLDGFGYRFLWSGSTWWNYYNMPVGICFVVIFLNLFCIEMVEIRRVKDKNRPYNIIYKLILMMFPVAVISALLFLFLPHYITFPLIAIVVMINFIFIAIAGMLLIIKEKNRQALFALLAGTMPIIGTVIYILRFFGLAQSNFFTRWAHYFGFVFMLILFSIILADRINQMRKGVKKAEMKYRNLVEGSDDIIFSLDEDLNFVSINTAVKKQLGFDVENVIGKNIMDFIAETRYAKSEITREIIEDYLNSLRTTKEMVTFKTDFKACYSHEPKEMLLKLEYADMKDSLEKILGKASAVPDDVILNFMKTEEHSYEIDNYLRNADLLSHRLTRNLAKFISKREVTEIRISLWEILINAIEHGNLNIHFQGKTHAQEEGRYLKFIQERQLDPRYHQKRVHIEYCLNKNEVSYQITDEGEGFDHTKIEDFFQKAQDGVLAHGRGLILAKEIFDDINFNEKGNSVMLVKRFDRL